MSLAVLWLLGVGALPLLVAGLARSPLPTERLRLVALLVSGMGALTGMLVFVVPELSNLHLDWTAPWQPVGGAALLSLTPLSVPLIALPSALWLTSVAVTPQVRLSREGLARTAWSTSIVTFAFMTRDPLLLVAAWTASALLFLRGLSSDRGASVRCVCARYLWFSIALLVAGVALVELEPAGWARELGMGLILAAVLVRKGIFPFHAWIPDAFDRGRIGPTVLFCAPQLGTYVAAVLVVPHASPTLLHWVALVSLVTALHGSVLALVQSDARRATGYVFVSQSALVLAGLDCTSVDALAGSLVLWGSSALAFTGMARTVLALEARRGRLDLRVHHGGYEQMPQLAVGFLVLALGCTGFAGTLGFVGEEMLLEGVMHEFPLAGLLIVATSAFTGLAVLRMYFSLFCGRPSGTSGLALRGREAFAISSLAVLLVVAGVFPQPIVRSRLRAAEILLSQRSHSGAARQEQGRPHPFW